MTRLSTPYDSDTTTGEILDNVNGHIHGPVKNLYPKYFAKVDCVSGNEVLHKVAGAGGDCSPLLSAAPPPEDFLQWLSSFFSHRLNGARRSWHTWCRPVFKNESAGRCAHLVLTHSTILDSRAEDGWHDVQVVGHFCQDDCIDYQEGFLSLCRLSRKVFANQPTRLFLHGLYIRRFLVELWIFDRSGMYSSETIDIRENFARFISVLHSYQSMTDMDLGRSGIVEKDAAGNYITLGDSTVAPLRKLYLENQPIALSLELVGEGTVCYRAKPPDSNQWGYVVKLKWRLARDRLETELLKLVKEKNAWGVISLEYCKEFDSIANLRQGLKCGLCRIFPTKHHQEGALVAADVQGPLCGAGGVAEYTEETNKTFEDRILTCLVISPAGRPLRTFKTVPELLLVFRDAIKGHRSLLQDAQILHQDVSAENIIITDAQGAGDPKGILIDLDVAMNLAIGPKTPGEVMGTRPFMAIGILKKRRHTYRHDLESFLYVLLWTIISNGSKNPPQTSKLRQWSRGSWYNSVTVKTADMDKDNFRSILAEFAPNFHSLKPLAETLRHALFPLEDGVLWTGTDTAPDVVNELYDSIIDAFEKAIALESESRIVIAKETSCR